MLKPTQEQQVALDIFGHGGNLILEAFAGAGITSTIEMMSKHVRGKKVLYAAFGKLAQLDAAKRFAGSNVEARTVHSLAYRGFGSVRAERMNSARFMPWRDKAQIIGVDDRYFFGAAEDNKSLSRETIVQAVTATVQKFASSAEQEVGLSHVVLPKNLVAGSASLDSLRRFIMGKAQRYWLEVTASGGVLPYEAQFYVKEWQLSNPVLPYDIIFNDEAQDSDDCTSQVFSAQKGTQIVAVGDPHQQIFEWRGAVNAMEKFGGLKARLTQSFRFGQAVADEANVFLGLLGAAAAVRGFGAVKSVVVGESEPSEAVLVRSNSGALDELFNSISRDVSVTVASDRLQVELKKLAKAAVELKERGSTNHKDLSIFNDWDEVVEFSKTDDGREIASLVSAVETVGAGRMLKVLNSLPDRDSAEQVIATAHTAKGLEWGSVRLGDDWERAKPRVGDDGVLGGVEGEFLRLGYVAVTRAKKVLDCASLAWVRDLPGQRTLPDHRKLADAGVEHVERKGWGEW